MLPVPDSLAALREGRQWSSSKKSMVQSESPAVRVKMDASAVGLSRGLQTQERP